MLRQWIRLTPIQCFLLTIIGVAAIATIYYFRTYGHYRLSSEMGWYGPPVVQAGKTIAILEGKISSDAGRERLIQLIRDFAKKKRFNIQVSQFMTEKGQGYDIKMWLGSTIFIGGNGLSMPELFDLTVIEDDPRTDKVAKARSLAEELRVAISQIPDVTVTYTKQDQQK